MASDTDLWLSLSKHQERYSRIVDKAQQDIVINKVNMPEPKVPEATPDQSSAATPINKRVLDQEEFNKNLKAKRAIFSKSRSLSLASFKMSVPKIRPPKLILEVI